VLPKWPIRWSTRQHAPANVRAKTLPTPLIRPFHVWGRLSFPKMDYRCNIYVRAGEVFKRGFQVKGIVAIRHPVGTARQETTSFGECYAFVYLIHWIQRACSDKVCATCAICTMCAKICAMPARECTMHMLSCPVVSHLSSF
jgi:hypothetical protein